ncbi:MAG: SGNH/GDSL hydrolase family protein [Bacteroidetes bacterium]|nr:SGNH/GDSL hydrolase family protein [Bacteroidota bacterium]MCL6102120.1 SGNH/GDSL hydrolase family protein [Bacteroidota bacterium]
MKYKIIFSLIIFKLLACSSELNVKADSPENGVNILILGNSITKHGPAPEIGWYGNWGMAASEESKDYVHILMQYFHQMNPSIRVRYASIADFERGYWNFNPSKLDSLRNKKSSLIILRIGENVDPGNIGKYDFKKYYSLLIRYFKNSNPNTKIISVTSFWKKPSVDLAMEEVSKDEFCNVVKLGYLSADSTNMAIGQYQNSGVAMHPNDKGMAAIANEIWEEVKTYNLYFTSGKFNEMKFYQGHLIFQNRENIQDKTCQYEKPNLLQYTILNTAVHSFCFELSK